MDGQGGSSPRVARLWLAPRGQPQATRSLAQKPDLTQTIGQTRGVREDLQPHAPAASAANLDHDPAQRLLAACTPAPAALLEAAQEELVDLDLALERLALRRDHRRPELVQHHPRRLVTTDPQLTLQLDRGDPRMMRGDQVGRPEPQ